MQSSSLCPSCGRHTGPHEACPYCGARLQPRISMRVFRYGSLAVACIGLAVMWFFSLRSPIPTLKIGQAQATMNFAYVRISGRVARPSSYDAEGGYLGFWIQDDTGEMMVSSYRSTTQALLAAGKLPDVGDQVTLEGTLRIRDEMPSLTLASAETVHITHPQASPYQIGDITAYDALTAVTVRGQVRAIKTPYEGLTLLTLRDETGAIDVAVSETASGVSGTGAAGNVQPGDSVEVSGAVTLYKDTPQIALTSSGKLIKLDEKIEIAPLARVADLSAEQVGRFARVEGEVVQLKPFSAGVKLEVDDGTGRVTLLLWSDVYTVLPEKEKIVEGAIVSAQGEISQYRGEMELVTESPSDVALLAKSTAGQAAQKSIGQITTADQGQTVAVSGVILESKRLSTGTRFVVADETGQIILLMWDDVLSQTPDRDNLAVGAQVAAQGKVDVYKDELELVPRQGTDVIVTSRAALMPTPTFPPLPQATATPQATPTAAAPTATPPPTALPLPAAVNINTITRDALGQSVTIKGQVVDVTSSSAGYTFWLNDGTGRIDLFTTSGVYGHIAGRSGLRLGAQVLATGEVKEYKGALEVAPSLGENVIVLAAGGGPAALRTIASLSEGDKDQFVTVQGSILSKETLSGGVRLRLHDDSGDIDVILWDNVMAYAPGSDKLIEGAALVVTGKVGSYRGALQIVPQLGYDVRISN